MGEAGLDFSLILAWLRPFSPVLPVQSRTVNRNAARIFSALCSGPRPTPGQKRVISSFQTLAFMFSGQKGQVRHWLGRPS